MTSYERILLNEIDRVNHLMQMAQENTPADVTNLHDDFKHAIADWRACRIGIPSQQARYDFAMFETCQVYKRTLDKAISDSLPEPQQLI